MPTAVLVHGILGSRRNLSSFARMLVEVSGTRRTGEGWHTLFVGSAHMRRCCHASVCSSIAFRKGMMGLGGDVCISTFTLECISEGA